MNSRIMRQIWVWLWSQCHCSKWGAARVPAHQYWGLTKQNGSVNMMVSDAATEDWATIGVRISRSRSSRRAGAVL